MVCVEQNRDTPLPIVQLNRRVRVVGVVGGLILRQSLLTTALFFAVLSAVLFGRRGRLIFQAGGSWRNAKALYAGEVEDPRLMRFSSTIAAMLLGGAQLAFRLGPEGGRLGTLAGGSYRGRRRSGGLRRLLLLLPVPNVPFSGVW
jgi:hypothetical protein